MSSGPQLDRRHFRFGVFELNTVAGELRKHGIRVRLQEQPLKLLLCLLETPGEVCEREALIRRIWPEGTFVDYDRGLNSAATRLRKVMGDSAEAPRYIETVGRRGYRFIAPVEQIAHPGATAPATPLDGNPPVSLQAAAATLPLHEEQRTSRRVWIYLALLATGLTAGIFIGWWPPPRPALKSLVRLTVDLDPDLTVGGLGPGLALAPDGSRLALTVRRPDGTIRLATRPLDQADITMLPGTEGASSPFFSPDGQWIAFFADGKLKKIALQGGLPLALADASTFVRGPRARFPAGSWGDDGNLVAMLNPGSGLVRIPSAGGSPALLTGLKRSDGEVDTWPQVLPGSSAVLFTRHQGDYESASLEVYSVGTGQRRTILKGGFFGRYLPDGHLIFIRRNTLFAVSFDARRLAITGTPEPLIENINSRMADWAFDFSSTGSFAYLSHNAEPQRSLFWVDPAGSVSPLIGSGASSDTSPRFSPDGRRLAFSRKTREQEDIWVLDIDRGAASRLTALPGANTSPVWTPDGLNIIFRSVDQPKPGIYAVSADGSGEAHRLLDSSGGEFPSSVSPDGKHLAIWAGGRVWAGPLQRNGRDVSLGKPVLILESRFNPAVPGRMLPAFSPDGRWLAYCANDSEQLEVYVVPFPGPGGKWRISTHGGAFPAWSRNSRELFFQDTKSKKIMVTTYSATGDNFSASSPHQWSEVPVIESGVEQTYDVVPDGKRLAVILYTDAAAEWKRVVKVSFLSNFFDELSRRVPLERR